MLVGSLVPRSNPRPTIQNLLRVTSIILTGSQNPSVIPGIGIGEPQAQSGDFGFLVSLFAGALPSLPIFILPIERGNKHDQQTSVIGLTKRAPHVTLALADRGIIIAIITAIISLCFVPDRFLVCNLAGSELKTGICRY
jgi:hypothetical protein